MDTYWFVYITIFLVALIQVPLGVDMLRFVFPQWRLARVAGQTVHPLLFIVVGTIFCIGLGYHLFVYLPLLAGEHPLQSIKGVVHVVFALWVWVNVVGNYYYSVSLHPGKDEDYTPPTRRSRAPVLCYLSEDGVITEVKEELQEPGGTVQQRRGRESDTQNKFYCASYLVGTKGAPGTGADWSPPRTHYCKICECAVPYLDHHCPFTGNCAGLRNYSYFVTGLAYGTLGLFYAVVITLPYFFECNLNNVLWYFGLVSSRVTSEVCNNLGAHSHIFLPVFAGFYITGNMLLIQILFLASDLSTYNILTNWSKFPMLRFMLQRMKAKKYRDKGSRLNVLILSQRKNILQYLFPCRPAE